ncbi:hypothetical protein [Flavobacterium collinsii]|uniref:Uncharacterized protein n=1 Tax=Flavobacterium collinsii TaxID=1114861 RepID=A0A9W4TI91_9FLAO|nr:hypothetical protein [Flavobacterium collinsii]CAI2767659.1 protein of unknown function [Flavobacterium collinsii]
MKFNENVKFKVLVEMGESFAVKSVKIGAICLFVCLFVCLESGKFTKFYLDLDLRTLAAMRLDIVVVIVKSLRDRFVEGGVV